MPARIEGGRKTFRGADRGDLDENTDANPLRGPGRRLTPTGFEVIRKTTTPQAGTRQSRGVIFHFQMFSFKEVK
ncbi:hypothetical protein AKJ37_07725 [candidate division MSBL1 archaeon SCGC-AAA259I09]|uniref:Uncharacterized protein n=1 Tax=candidate division MSBL1 archaeon SCGC-AAA259I09 TaxID=1698267 RepID=A0A133UJC8_9EURY|nr:hypothetical protein AKJ37_07725 [candidate division MSBL1 archaeon SCGC-AAA259I09]